MESRFPAPMAALFAGLVPMAAVVVAYIWNIQHGMDACNPFWDGCTSVSRAIRSGPGLWLFKLAAIPTVLCMAWTWLRLPPSLQTQITRWLGVLGAGFLLVYAATLGTEGDLYRWMRRYGVVLYFGFTGIAQLLVAAKISRRGAWRRVRAELAYLAVIVITWSMGVLSAFKRQLIDDPSMQDRLQNALEWYFALALSLAFMVLSANMRRES